MTELHSGCTNNSCHFKTVITVKTYTYDWTVDNFSKLPLNDQVRSPPFHLTPNHTFIATLEKNNSLCCLTFEKTTGSDIQIKHQLSIMDSTEKVLFKQFKSHKYRTQHETLSCNVASNFISDMRTVCDNVTDDILIFKCVMELGEVKTMTSQYKFRPKTASQFQNLSALSSDLQAMYSAFKYADVSLKVDDSVLRVHKSVMCARSSVFSQMFETPIAEKEKNVVSITDLELDVLKDLVTFLYSGTLAKDDFESAYALYYAADKYDVPSLRKTCSDVLLSKLDFENAFHVLVLADRHSDVELKDAVMDFIKFYHNEVLDTDAWDEFVQGATLLAAEVMALRGKKQNKSNTVKYEPVLHVNSNTSASVNVLRTANPPASSYFIPSPDFPARRLIVPAANLYL